VHKFLQINKIAHCDIKPENILITNIETLEIKICDIGSGKQIKNENTNTGTICGTVPFIAPELMNNISNSKLSHNPFKSDVFSLGLCIVYLVTFNKVNNSIKFKFSCQQRSLVIEDAFKDVLERWIYEAKVITDDDMLISTMLDNMLKYDIKERPDFVKLMEIYEEEECKLAENKQQ
jgi:serine/threonine protein kinase